DGVALDQVSDESLFRLLAVQLQHNHFFVGTVRENLQLAKSDASDEEMKKLLAYVELDFDLNDSVEEKALNFSGGERQRLAYARMLLQNKPVLLLDEPFSSIDIILKGKFMGDLNKRNETVIMITHDVQSLKYFDTIYAVTQQTIKKIDNIE
ncbi:MAG: ATP-binding cassette domain-containing protein, partial [Lysinibacillus sp.]